MQVVDHEPGSWSLVAHDGRLLLDVQVEPGSAGRSVVVDLDDDERNAYRSEGRASLTRLAATVRDASPARGSTPHPGHRDLSSTLGAEVARAVATWHATGDRTPTRRPSPDSPSPVPDE